MSLYFELKINQIEKTKSENDFLVKKNLLRW